jgi:hypothetical protein
VQNSRSPDAQPSRSSSRHLMHESLEGAQDQVADVPLVPRWLDLRPPPARKEAVGTILRRVPHSLQAWPDRVPEVRTEPGPPARPRLPPIAPPTPAEQRRLLTSAVYVVSLSYRAGAERGKTPEARARTGSVGRRWDHPSSGPRVFSCVVRNLPGAFATGARHPVVAGTQAGLDRQQDLEHGG